MNNRDKLKRKIIEAIHNLPYEEAVKIEWGETTMPDYYKGLPCTIGRVMQALVNKYKNNIAIDSTGTMMDMSGFPDVEAICYWQLTKDGRELTLDDQTDETCDAILNLLK